MTNKKLPLALLVAALAAVLALASVSAFGGDNGGGGKSADTNADVHDETRTQDRDDALLALARRDADDPFALGDADAPVVMIEYSDFQCPFCGKFARDTKPELVKKYVDDGVLRIEWRQFPIFGQESEDAARAGYAAGQQGKFWDFHDVVYGTKRKKNGGDFAQDKLEAYAREAGVSDLDRFRKDMKGDDAKAAIGADTSEGYGLGVSSTPAFLVNGEPVLGAQPTEVFVEVVEQARKAADKADEADEADKADTADKADEADE